MPTLFPPPPFASASLPAGRRLLTPVTTSWWLVLSKLDAVERTSWSEETQEISSRAASSASLSTGTSATTSPSESSSSETRPPAPRSASTAAALAWPSAARTMTRAVSPAPRRVPPARASRSSVIFFNARRAAGAPCAGDFADALSAPAIGVKRESVASAAINLCLLLKWVNSFRVVLSGRLA